VQTDPETAQFIRTVHLRNISLCRAEFDLAAGIDPRHSRRCGARITPRIALAVVACPLGGVTVSRFDENEAVAAASIPEPGEPESASAMDAVGVADLVGEPLEGRASFFVLDAIQMQSLAGPCGVRVSPAEEPDRTAVGADIEPPSSHGGSLPEPAGHRQPALEEDGSATPPYLRCTR
jgi:hypothetical protein